MIRLNPNGELLQIAAAVSKPPNQQHHFSETNYISKTRQQIEMLAPHVSMICGRPSTELHCNDEG